MDIMVENQSWGREAHATMTATEFVTLYSTGHDHIYSYLSAKDKAAALKTAAQALGLTDPAPVAAEKKK